MLPVTFNNYPKRHNDELALYLRRLTKPKQMEWEFALWTMLQLLISPKTVYRQTSYHRQTKGGWCRDDPAFVVLSAGGMAVLSLIFNLIFNESLSNILYVAISTVFVYYLACGFVLATITWNIANKLLHSRLPSAPPHINTAAGCDSTNAVVDWPFCFDVHCSMVPLVALLGGRY
jgi:UNC-50 family